MWGTVVGSSVSICVHLGLGRLSLPRAEQRREPQAGREETAELSCLPLTVATICNRKPFYQTGGEEGNRNSSVEGRKLLEILGIFQALI